MTTPRQPHNIDLDGYYVSQQTLMWTKVVTGLATLQDAIQTLSSAYIKHTNAVLGEHGAGLDVESALAKLGENPLLKLGELNRGISPAGKFYAAGDPAASGKKERKKRQHDPNAPKRPLTPFFLYMQTARPIIANDLGAEAAKGAVSDEGTRRWGTMAAEDKQLWTNAYKDNLRLYNARMHSYKAGNALAKEMSDDDALIYADEHNISVENTADAQLAGESAAALHDEDAEGEPDKEPTPPPKTPKAKGGRKGKATPATAPESIVPPASSSIVPPKPVEKEKSPDKKRKRASKKSDEPTPTIEKEDLAVETPKSAPKPRKKKAKGE
ncbi:putative high mobility group protein 1 [Hyaloscypha sp. PMI_1271]|nr:putative high mobility group protein 1 [Hyaloscypha sp. PMI_1271]